MNAVPMGNSRPPCVNASRVVWMRMSSRSASIESAAAPAPHGIRNPIVPGSGSVLPGRPMGQQPRPQGHLPLVLHASTDAARSLATTSTSNMSGRLHAVTS
jgi:hypothetical protein